MTYEEKVKRLRELNDAYYRGEPLVTDATYDALHREVVQMENDDPSIIDPTSPTQKVGNTTKMAFEAVAHHAPMLSLKTEVDVSDKPIIDFVERTYELAKENGYSVTPKFDGLGIDLHYKGHLGLVAAVTRGDGLVGESVLHIVGKLPDKLIPKKFQRMVTKSFFYGKSKLIQGAFITCDIRGEIVLPKNAFEQINKKLIACGSEPYSNPRNAAAGLLRRLEYDPELHDQLRFYPYDIGWGEGSNYETMNQNEYIVYSHFSANGFVTPANFLILPTGKDLETRKQTFINFLKETYETYEKKRNTLDYDIDGVVYKLISYEARKSLGYSGREPRWAIAHKFVPEQATTVVNDIVIQVGKTGRLTPVAILTPVKCGGVEITNANLHHEEQMKHIDIQVGDTVVVHRAGDVVPEVVCVDMKHPQNTTPQDYSAYFTSCPECGSTPIKRGMLWYCDNIAGCPGMLSARLYTAVSRAYLDIEDLGPKTIDRLIETEDLKSVAGIFKLTAEALKYAGVADSLIVNILDHIQKAKALPLERIIASIGIPSLGVSTARTLLSVFPTLQEIASLDKQKIASIPRYKDALGEKLIAGIEQASFEFTQLLEIDFSSAKAVVASNGINVCVSGRLPAMDKTSIVNLLLSKGFNVVSSVSSKLNYLVGCEETTAKYRKALDLGIPIISTTNALQALVDDPK